MSLKLEAFLKCQADFIIAALATTAESSIKNSQLLGDREKYHSKYFAIKCTKIKINGLKTTNHA